METWKDIIGFEGLYQVSDTGKVKSMKRKSMNAGSYNGFVSVQERELKQTINRLGYHVLTLFKDGCRHFRIVHRLVAEAFLENKKKYKEVNHKDLDKSNNHVSNLEWCDRSYNINHSYTKRYKSSIYKGVSYSEERKSWVAYLELFDRRLMLGRHKTELDAKNYRQEFINKLKKINYEELV